jgi:hypothetical protein
MCGYFTETAKSTMPNRYTTSALIVLGLSSAAACGRIAPEPTEKGRAEMFEPDADCVDTPQLHQSRLTTSAEEATAGCREFGEGGCTECCSSWKGFDGKSDVCVVLSAQGERRVDSLCDPECPACARCSVEDEATLYRLARSLECDCRMFSGGLGFNPDVPCDRDCYYLADAPLSPARWLPHPSNSGPSGKKLIPSEAASCARQGEDANSAGTYFGP